MPSPDAPSFPASYDRTTKIVSAGVCLLFVVLAIATKLTIIAVLGAVIAILAYGYSPRGYEISGRSVFVKRLIGNVEIPLDGTRELRPSTKEDFQGCIRLFGSGGMFGYYGLFRTSKLGKCSWYMANRKAVVLITGTKTALFSPDDVNGFLAAVLAVVHIPPSAVQAGAVEPLSGTKSVAKRFLVPAIGLAVTGGVIGLISITTAYSPGPPKLTLTQHDLTIHDRFYPVTLQAAAVDVEQIRIVDLAVDKTWRPTLRTNGFANSHYRSGWFRVANGQTVRLYQASSKRLILLPPKGAGTTVLAEVAAPEQLVEQLRRDWPR